MNFGVVAGVGAYDDVGVGVFPVDLCRDAIPMNYDIATYVEIYGDTLSLCT